MNNNSVFASNKIFHDIVIEQNQDIDNREKDKEEMRCLEK